MDWQSRMAQALECLESQLTRNMDLEQVARAANCSSFHFMRMFEVVTGMGPGEYLRRRRLSQAALDLVGGSAKVIDLALKYGYESPDAFSRAFKREFGCLPSEARQTGRRLHSYPPLSFSIALIGDKAMEYRIENGPAYRLLGIDLKTNCNDGSNFREIPRFWDRCHQSGDFAKLAAKCRNDSLGVVGVCHSFDKDSGAFIYSIAIEMPEDRSGLPAGMGEIMVPASTWGKFSSRGPLHQNFQPLIRRIFSEWFPASGREHAGGPEIEYYWCSDKPLEDPDYLCEYWVPLK